MYVEQDHVQEDVSAAVKLELKFTCLEEQGKKLNIEVTFLI